MTDTQVTWLTQEAYDQAKAELDQLIANRPVIAAEINDRREEGDLRENGGYHAAREEQGQQEARIRQLQELLNNAKVGEAPKQSGVALPGSVVKVYFNGRREGHRDVPDRDPPGGRQRRQARGLLAQLAARQRADRREGRRDQASYTVPNGKHHEGHARQRGAVPLLTQPAGRAIYGPFMAQIAEDLFLLLLDNASRSPRWSATARAGTGRLRCSSTWRSRAGSGPPSPASRSSRAGCWRSLATGRLDPSSSRRIRLLQQRAAAARSAAVSKLRKDVQEHIATAPRATGPHRPQSRCPPSGSATSSRWPLPTGSGWRRRARRCCRRCSTASRRRRRRRRSSSLLHCGGRARRAAEPQRPRLALGARSRQRNRQWQLGRRVSDGAAGDESRGDGVGGAVSANVAPARDRRADRRRLRSRPTAAPGRRAPRVANPRWTRASSRRDAR